MLKKALFVLIGGVLAFGLATNAMAAEKTLFRLGIGNPINSGAGAMALHFKKLVEAKSNGKITIELFPNSVLGDELEMFQNVRRGTLDMTIIGIGNAVPFIPALGLLTLPYLLETEEEVVKATTGDLFNYFNEQSIKLGGMRILGTVYSNYRHLTNSKRPISSMAEAKNLKLRVPNNKIYVTVFQAWGLNPVPMAWSETFTALQQGVVDGQVNPHVVNHTMKFHEVQDYTTELRYEYVLEPLFIGEKTFAKLSPETQKILMDSAREAQMANLIWENAHADAARASMEKAGMKVQQLTDEAAWKKIALEEVWPQYYDFVGGKDALDTVLEKLGKKK